MKKARKVKCVYIHDGKIEPFEFEHSLERIYELVDCRCIGIVERKIGGKYFDIIHDDEFLLNGKADELPAMISVEYENRFETPARKEREYLFGNLLITSHNREGDTTSLTEEQITHILEAQRFMLTNGKKVGQAIFYEF